MGDLKWNQTVSRSGATGISRRFKRVFVCVSLCACVCAGAGFLVGWVDTPWRRVKMNVVSLRLLATSILVCSVVTTATRSVAGDHAH